MTHDELLEKIYLYCIYANDPEFYGLSGYRKVLLAVAELHKPIYDNSCFDADCCGGPYPDLCNGCGDDYPCPTIQAIEKELK